MAVAAAVSQLSPSSLQVRLGLERRKFSPACLQVRFPTPGERCRRVRLVVTGSLDSKSGDGASEEPLGGWFGEDSEEGSTPEGKFRGMWNVLSAG